MKKYSNEVIINYINGLDVPYDIEELENDYLFMIEVLNLSNDKNMYNMCSSSVKRNYKFVKLLILKFKSDIDFICNVFDYYYENSSNEKESIDLLITLVNILEKKDIEKFMFYKMRLLTYHIKNKIVFDKIKEEDPDDKLNMGLGFYLIFDDYYDNKNVMDFYASSFINDIFNDNGFTLEDVLHDDFNNFKEFEKNGINNYLINFIGRYDKLLRDYNIAHLYLLDNLKGKLEYIKSNWDNYIEEKRKLRYEILYERVSNYIYDNDYMFNEFEVLCVLAKRYKIEKDFANYFDIEDCFEDLVITSGFNLINKNDLKTIRIYNDVNKIFCEVMFSKEPVTEDNYLDDTKSISIVRLKVNKKS